MMHGQTKIKDSVVKIPDVPTQDDLFFI